jgi:hypothetical protein
MKTRVIQDEPQPTELSTHADQDAGRKPPPTEPDVTAGRAPDGEAASPSHTNGESS